MITRTLVSVLLLVAMNLACISVCESSEKETIISGQEGIGVQVDVKAGFEGIFRSSIPFPVEVYVFNANPSNLQGKLSISTSNWIPPCEYILSIDVPSETTMCYEMFIYERSSNELTVRLLNSRNEPVLEEKVAIREKDIERSNVLLVLSENPDDFSFLDEIAVPGLNIYRTQARARSNFPPNFNLSGIHVIRSMPPHLKSKIYAWESINSVFCDLKTYAGLDETTLMYLKDWVLLGGELILYSTGSELDSDTLEKINADDFLPFRITGFSNISKNDSTMENGIIHLEKNSKIPDVQHKKASDQIYFREYDKYLISSYIQGAGGITLFHFDADSINPKAVVKWVQVLFQLGILNTQPMQFGIRNWFNGTITQGAARLGYVPLESEKYFQGISNILSRSVILFLVPVAIVICLMYVAFRRKKQIAFILYVLPVTIVLTLIIPDLLTERADFSARQLDVFSLLQLSDDKMPSPVYSVILTSKAFPDVGILRVESPGELSFYDEMVNAYLGTKPKLLVDNTPPGSLESSERTTEPFRALLLESEIDGIGIVDGKVEILSDGSIRYELINNTDFNLVNCEILTIKQVMDGSPSSAIPDMKPGEKISGLVQPVRENITQDNANLMKFARQFHSALFDSEDIREILYSLESGIISSAYRSGKHVNLYSDELLFYAWTADFKKKMQVDEIMNNNPQITAVMQHLKMEKPVGEYLVTDEDIESIIKSQPVVDQRSDQRNNNTSGQVE
jgi:hypothetical protein